MTDEDALEASDADEPGADASGTSDVDALSASGERSLEAQPIEPAAPDAFGRTQVWWGDGKGKTTAALGMGFRAAGHGYRVHLLQFMKGGTGSVEDVRGEYNAIHATPGFTYEHSGHYGWHGRLDATDDDDHESRAQAGLERAEELLTAAADVDLSNPIGLDAPPEDGIHLLILDELCYAANRDLVAPDDVTALLDAKPDALELVLTGGHDEPTYVTDRADLVTNVAKQTHPFDAGVRARKGTEF